MEAATNRHRQQGLTLIELMISITIGMVLTSVMLMLFSDSAQRSQDLSRASAQIENGRYASDLLAEDVALAGFWGTLPTDGAAYSNVDPCSTDPSAAWITAPLTIPAAVRALAPDSVFPCLSNRKPGTAALLIRRLATTEINPTILAGGNKQYYLQTSFCQDDPVATPFVLSRAKAQFTLLNRACAAPNTARAYMTRIYFIAACNRCGSDTSPTLKRVDLTEDRWVETALVDGVDTLLLEMGFDTDGNGSVDSYLSDVSAAGATADWGNVMSVKLHFLTRSIEPARNLALAATAQTFTLGSTVVNTPADGYLRRAYSQTIRLVNPSAAREHQ
jgi:type IV pilus assembly protein PilW